MYISLFRFICSLYSSWNVYLFLSSPVSVILRLLSTSSLPLFQFLPSYSVISFLCSTRSISITLTKVSLSLLVPLVALLPLFPSSGTSTSAGSPSSIHAFTETPSRLLATLSFYLSTIPCLSAPRSFSLLMIVILPSVQIPQLFVSLLLI